MNAYIFVLAAALAVFPILFVFKITLERIKENPQSREKAQTQFFIWVALSETIPIILIVFGFMNLAPATSITDLYIPGLIVIILMGFAALFIFLQRAVGVPEDSKEFVNTFAMVGFALVNAIPIIAIVSLFLMVP